MVTDFDVLDEISLSYDDPSALVATNEWKLSCERPVTVQGVEIGVTDTRVFDVDENLVWSWLLDGDLLVIDGSSSLLDDLCPLHIWDVGGHCCGCMVFLTVFG
jgi:hypothetical protein